MTRPRIVSSTPPPKRLFPPIPAEILQLLSEPEEQEEKLGPIAAAPADFALSPFERRLTQSVTVPRHPLILVCGAPRSGTTVVYQTLVNHLPVAYFSNLTALFPRSPLAAQRLSTARAGA